MKKYGIAMCIMGLCFFVAVGLLSYERWNYKHIKECDIPQTTFLTGKISDMEITSNDIGIELKGRYKEREQLTAINLKVMLISEDNSVAYFLYTEYMIPEATSTGDTMDVYDAGFYARIFYDSWTGQKGQYRICVLNQSNGKNEILSTDKTVDISNGR